MNNFQFKSYHPSIAACVDLHVHTHIGKPQILCSKQQAVMVSAL